MTALSAKPARRKKIGPTSLALAWHFHQPCYRDLVSGRPAMPWVRLHGIKDYWGMAALLEEFPAVKCAANFVPALLDQLEAAAAGEGLDEFELLARQSPADWSEAERNRALDVFFFANWDRMIRVHPRYGELLEARAPWKQSAEEAAADFTAADLRDLAAWFTLAWYHPLAVERDAGLSALQAKGRDFTEADKLYVLDRQRSLLAEVIPLWRRLAERGQIELTTTPHYHPILPLLADMSDARVAMPGVKLPAHWKPLVADAREQLRRAVESHQRRFGEKPRGCWPSEGSVSGKVVPLLAEAGFKWAASDEDILAYSRGGTLGADRGDLYQPYRLEAGASGGINMIFRDRGLSDLIGFVYHSWWEQEAAGRDFVAKVRGCGHALVTVILDGENCWEHYPAGGVPFLRELYGELSRAAEKNEVLPVRPGDYLAHRRPQKLARLWPGSWINHDFYIWAGHHEDQEAWDYLFRVRADLEKLTAALTGTGTGSREAQRADRSLSPEAGGVPGTRTASLAPLGTSGACPRSAQDSRLALAWECLYAAEGSDWCWWYGDDHNSGNDAAFDELFRRHLQNVYRALGRRPPAFLEQPIKGATGPRQGTRPSGRLQVTLDGRVTSYDEWLPAGCYRTAAGAMDRSGPPPLVEMLFYGADESRLLLRADFDTERRGELDVQGLRLAFTVPGPATVTVEDFVAGRPRLTVSSAAGEWRSAEAAFDSVLELAVPLARLGLTHGGDCAFAAELLKDGLPVERFPLQGEIRFALPDGGE